MHDVGPVHPAAPLLGVTLGAMQPIEADSVRGQWGGARAAAGASVRAAATATRSGATATCPRPTGGGAARARAGKTAATAAHSGGGSGAAATGHGARGGASTERLRTTGVVRTTEHTEETNCRN
jgi:hypothetical protein